MDLEFVKLSIDSDLLIKLGVGFITSTQAVLIAYLKITVDKQKRDLDFAFGVFRGWYKVDMTRKKGDKK